MGYLLPLDVCRSHRMIRNVLPPTYALYGSIVTSQASRNGIENRSWLWVLVTTTAKHLAVMHM